MKKNYTLSLIVILMCSFLQISLKAQNTYLTNPKYPKWRLGLNMGGTWQTNDIKKNYAHLAGGFNIERILNKREDAPIGFSLGFRYLSGNTSGYDNVKDTALSFNTALNGNNTYGTSYDSIPGYFYNNYRSHIAEGAFELKMNFPAMEKNTHFIFHLWGGLGWANYKTRINALNDTGAVWNYSTLNANPSINNIKTFYSGDFESVANRDVAANKLVFTPSLGIGLGYRFNKHVSLVFEHKVSFPATNTLDGRQYSSSTSFPLKNDIYHYTAAHLIFTIWGRSHATYTNTNTTTTNTTTVNGNNNNNNSTTVVNNNQPKPIITIYSPGTNPYTTTNNIQQVTGVAQYVNSSSNLNISVNGYQVNDFTFNPNNGSFSFNSTLIPGANNVNIIASNNAGQDNEALTINYNPVQNPNNNVPNGDRPPQVTITYPNNNYISNAQTINVNATVSNVSSSANVAISANGYAINNFNFNPYNGAVSFSVPLNAGTNNIIVSAFNNAGNDAAQINVLYQNNQTNPVIVTNENKPVVSFNNPPSSPFQSVTNVFYVTAKVTNVTAASQVSVSFNGLPVNNFTFTQYGFVNFTANLATGSNVVVVTGTNNAGSDTKTATINYKEAGFPPVVTIINPAVSPTTINAATTNVIATVTNVSDQNNIKVLINNVVSAFTYNTGNQTVTIPTNLSVGLNSITVTATTNFGTDTKTQTIERKEEVIVKPVVNILNPATAISNTNNINGSLTAQILHVLGPKQISVKNNGNNVPFNYDQSTQQLNLATTLIQGANVFVITATNSAGSATQTGTINFTPPTAVSSRPPSVTIVDPASNPFSTYDATLDVKALTNEINSQNQVSVNVNGAAAAFTFNTTGKEVNVPMNLTVGTNTLTIVVTNQSGSDSKTLLVERINRPKVFLPIVNIINPASNPFNSSLASYNVNAEVLNVNSSADITVTKANVNVPFTFDNATHLVKFTASLNVGANTYIIKGANTAGVDSKTLVINYEKKVDGSTTVPVNKPVVSITNPATANSTTFSNTQVINANITNISQANQAAVLVNGIAVTNFTFSNGNISFTANLNLGLNSVSVTGTNIAGSDNKTITIQYNKTPENNTNVTVEKPVVTITTPASSPFVTNTSSTIVIAGITNVTSISQVSVKINGNATNNFSFVNGTVTMNTTLNLGANTVSITGTNPAGSDTKSVTITYEKKSDGGTVVANEKPVVTITTPSNANHATSVTPQAITATVTNITTSNQVKVVVNGIQTNNFIYNNGNVSLTVPLNLGANTVSITGTNPAGSDTKSVTITYEKKSDGGTVVANEKPVVTITTPSNANHTTSVTPQAITATVTNITTSNQVKVVVNGIQTNNFIYNNGNVSLTVPLNLGANTISITGTNPAGSDTKSVTITYEKKSDGGTVVANEKPVVIITGPSYPNFTTTTSPQIVTATITNVSTSSQIKVTVNGTLTNNFTFNNGSVSITVPLSIGNNTINVTGSNNAGSDTKTENIEYKKVDSGNILMPPVVTFTSSNPQTTEIEQLVTANITNVTNASQVEIKTNGNIVSNFTFANGNVSFTANLKTGQNNVSVTGTNSVGTDTKSITILRRVSKPVVQIKDPATSPFTTTGDSYTIKASVYNVNSSAEITVSSTSNSNIAFTYNASSKEVTIPVSIGNEYTTFTITASNSGGTDSKSVEIKYNMGISETSNTISICHYPNGPTSTPIQIQIPKEDWPAHKAHGDVKGVCPASNPTINGNNTGSNNNGSNSNGTNNNGSNNSGTNNNGSNGDGGKTNNNSTPKSNGAIVVPKMTPKTATTPTTTPKAEPKKEEPKKEEPKKTETGADPNTPKPRMMQPK